MENVQLIVKIVIGWVIIILGGSFAWKCYRAVVQGKLTYWQGFLPLSIISPLLVHIKAKENTLLKDTTGLWVHLLMGPLFFVLSILFLAVGADLVGFAGTDTLNLILGGGNPTAPPVIVYSKNYTFRFPIFVRVANKFRKSVNSVFIPLAEKDKYPGYVEPTAEQSNK